MPPTPKPTKQKKQKRKNPKSERKALEKELDRLTSLIVRKRDGFCVTCGSRDNLQCGHLIKRGRKWTRWDLRNCNCQCASCNIKHNYYPEIYTEWFIGKYGLDLYKSLVAWSQLPVKHSETWLKDKVVEYQGILAYV